MVCRLHMFPPGLAIISHTDESSARLRLRYIGVLPSDVEWSTPRFPGVIPEEKKEYS
jgi:hypothetical protein